MKRITMLFLSMLLIATFIASPCYAFEELSKGSKGDTVVELQNRLNELGYSVGKPDGDYGGKTEKAVKKFQVDNDLDVTGIVDESTFSALFEGQNTYDSTAAPADPEVKTALINRDEITDIWLWINNVCMLTSNGDVIMILSASESHPDAQIKTDATEVKKVMHDSDYIYTTDDRQWHRNDDQPYDIDEEWQDITLSAVGMYHAVGLKEDGTWVAAGAYADGECDVDEWTDIISIDAGYHHTVGLKADGTVTATGKNDHGQCNVSDWEDIIQIAVDGNTTLGLKSDGTVVATGSNSADQCEVSDWTNVKYICCGGDASFALTNEGNF